jgi:tRNA nucleotidyltransferase/poly(A) polymerase
MLQVVADILRRRHSEGWLVGGSVRDLGLGRFSPDLDIAVKDDPRAVAHEIARILHLPWFVLSERHPTFRVMSRDGHIDVAAVRGTGILTDLAERDFTVNAMALAVDVSAAFRGDTPLDFIGLEDPFGGLVHLREKRLVAVSDRIFVDDPLRMLRAVRLSHVLGLEPDDRLVDAIAAQASLLATTAVERVVAELSLTFAAGRSGVAVRAWQRLGLLEVVFPELRVTERVLDALRALERLDDLLSRPAEWFPDVADRLRERLDRPVDGALSRPVALRMAALLHRVPLKDLQEAGRRLKLSADANSLFQAVSGIMSGEERAALPVVPPGGRTGREAVVFMWQVAPWEPEVVLLCASVLSRQPVSHIISDATLERARALLCLWVERTAATTPRLPVDGEVLMRELGLHSGPLLGSVLRGVRLAWEAGEIDSAAGALETARAILAQRTQRA